MPARFGAYLNRDTIRKTLRVGLPIALGSVIWAVGIFMYSLITAQAGSQALAVLALVTPIESMAIAVMIGLSSTTNVIVGQALGRGNFRGATLDAISLVVWTICAAVLMGSLLWLLKPLLLWLYAGTGSVVLAITDDVFDVLAVVLTVRAINVTLVVGVLRAGADTAFPILMDVCAQWLVAIPLTAAAVVWLGLPFPWVFLAINAEELARLAMTYWRVTQFAWLKRIQPNGVS